MTNLAVGVDLGGTSIKAGLVSGESGMIRSISCDTDAHEGPSAVLDRMSSLISECLSDANLPNPPPVGIGSPGAVNWDRTTVSYPPNFADWHVVQMGSEIQTRLGFPVQIVVENDANVAALGSARFGAGRPFSSFLMVTLGTGVGGAIIHNRELFRGSTGAAGELGHMSIDYEGPVAESGVPGAIEAYIGQRFLSRTAHRILKSKPESLVHQMVAQRGTKITPEILFDAAKKGDAPSIEILAWAGRKLGAGLGSAVNLLDIRKIVIGGGLSMAGDFILVPAAQTLLQFVTPALRDGVEIVRETLGNDAGILGAAMLALQATGVVAESSATGVV